VVTIPFPSDLKEPAATIILLIDLGYPPPAVPCGLCRKATAGILQALREWLLR
jgi:hypothetical protein